MIIQNTFIAFKVALSATIVIYSRFENGRFAGAWKTIRDTQRNQNRREIQFIINIFSLASRDAAVTPRVGRTVARLEEICVPAPILTS